MPDQTDHAIAEAPLLTQIEFRRREDLAKGVEHKLRDAWMRMDRVGQALDRVLDVKVQAFFLLLLALGCWLRTLDAGQEAGWAAVTGWTLIAIGGAGIVTNNGYAYTLRRDLVALEFAAECCIGDWIAAGGTISQLAKLRDLATKAESLDLTRTDQVASANAQQDEHWQTVRQVLLVRAGGGRT